MRAAYCFEFERSDLYNMTLEFLVFADLVAISMGAGRGYLREQLRRSALALVRHTALGVAEESYREHSLGVASKTVVRASSQLHACTMLALGDPVLVLSCRQLLYRIALLLRNALAKDLDLPPLDGGSSTQTEPPSVVDTDDFEENVVSFPSDGAGIRDPGQVQSTHMDESLVVGDPGEESILLHRDRMRVVDTVESQDECETLDFERGEISRFSVPSEDPHDAGLRHFDSRTRPVLQILDRHSASADEGTDPTGRDG